jgi:hypothetical protein
MLLPESLWMRHTVNITLVTHDLTPNAAAEQKEMDGQWHF